MKGGKTMLRKTKRAIAVLLCLVMSLLSISYVALAEEPIKVLLNGTELSFDQPPILENDRTLVPMRGIFEALGATVEWEESTQTITSTKDDITIIMQIGKHSFTKNGQEITLDVPPKVVNDRTLVPVRAIAESFEAAVGWDGATSTVTISTVESTLNPAFSVPKVGYEYGPFTLTMYYETGNYWNSVKVDSFIVSKCEPFAENYYMLSANVRGISDSSNPHIIMKFYDSDNNVLGDVHRMLEVKENEEFNVSFNTTVNRDIIDNAVKTEFVSLTGEPAVYDTASGNGESGENNGNQGNDDISIETPDNNSSLDLEGYNKLKNELIKKGKYGAGALCANSYSLSRTNRDGSFSSTTRIEYGIEGEYISIHTLYQDTEFNHTSATTLRLRPGQSPQITIQKDMEHWFIGYIEGDTITNVYVETSASEEDFIEYALRDIEAELVILNSRFTLFDLDVTRQELGLPSSVKIE